MEPITLIKKNEMAGLADQQKASIFNLFKCRCPRCRKGKMFRDDNPWHLRNTMKMLKECSVCKQPFNIEVGFYYGSSYISYALSVTLSGASFVAWWLIIGFSLKEESSLIYWLIFNALVLIVTQPYLMRVARTGWLALFVRYNQHWKTIPPKQPERINMDEEDNW